MTKLLLALSLLTLSLFPSHFDKKDKQKAPDNDIRHSNERVMDTHDAMFGPANMVQWQQTDKGYWRANFESEGKQVTAFYQQDGRYLAHTMQRQLTDLPEKLRQTIASRFQPEALSEIIELFSANEAAWFIQVKTNSGQQVYKAFAYGHMMPYASTPL